MGLKWVKVDTDWPTNPKVTMLLDEGTKGRSALYAYVAALCYSGQHGLDGFVPRYALPVVQITPRDVTLLCQYELWHAEGDAGWRVNDWAEYQESTEETQKRAEKARKAAQRRWSKKASQA